MNKAHLQYEFGLKKCKENFQITDNEFLVEDTYIGAKNSFVYTACNFVFELRVLYRFLLQIVNVPASGVLGTGGIGCKR